MIYQQMANRLSDYYNLYTSYHILFEGVNKIHNKSHHYIQCLLLFCVLVIQVYDYSYCLI